MFSGARDRHHVHYTDNTQSCALFRGLDVADATATLTSA